MDHLQAFVDSELIVAPGQKIRSSKLFDIYTKWCGNEWRSVRLLSRTSRRSSGIPERHPLPGLKAVAGGAASNCVKTERPKSGE